MKSIRPSTSSLLAQLRPDLILGCGDLPFEYLDHLKAVTEVPLCYIRGNHDPARAVHRVPSYLPAQFPAQSAREKSAHVVGGSAVRTTRWQTWFPARISFPKSSSLFGTE